MNEQPKDELRLGALKALYDGQLARLKTLSERSFSTTLQALTLNLAVVAGLVGGKVLLSTGGQIIGSLLLVIFNSVIAWYLWSKACNHHSEKVKMHEVQGALATLAAVTPSDKPSFWGSFIGGSGTFILAVMMAAACSVVSLWVSLLR